MLEREDPNFVPPNTAHAGAPLEFNSKFASGVSLSKKRPRDDDDPIGREAKREKHQDGHFFADSDEEMKLEDDDDETSPAPKGEFACPHFFTDTEFTQTLSPQQHGKSLPGYSVQICPKKLQMTLYLSRPNSASPPFDPFAVHG